MLWPLAVNVLGACAKAHHRHAQATGLKDGSAWWVHATKNMVCLKVRADNRSQAWRFTRSCRVKGCTASACLQQVPEAHKRKRKLCAEACRQAASSFFNARKLTLKQLNQVDTPALSTAGLAPLAEDAARTPNRACRLPPGPCLLWCSSPGCRTKRAEQVRCMSVHSRAWRRRWRQANSNLCCAHGRAPSRARRPMSAMHAHGLSCGDAGASTVSEVHVNNP